MFMDTITDIDRKSSRIPKKIMIFKMLCAGRISLQMNSCGMLYGSFSCITIMKGRIPDLAVASRIRGRKPPMAKSLNSPVSAVFWSHIAESNRQHRIFVSLCWIEEEIRWIAKGAATTFAVRSKLVRTWRYKNHCFFGIRLDFLPRAVIVSVYYTAVAPT